MLIKSLFILIFAIGGPIYMSYYFKGAVSKYFSPPYSFNDIPNLNGKLAIVTGANSGIGKITARELARNGATVIATTRDKKKGESALEEINRFELNGTINFEQLDLASFESIKLFVDTIGKKYSKNIDILILNVSMSR